MKGNNNYIAILDNGSVYLDKENKAELPNPSGTSLVDCIDISYKELVDAFGEPNSDTDEYKVDAEWIIDTPAGVATIYNYKTGHNYLGEDGDDVWDITDWHIGGKNMEVKDWIMKSLELSKL